MLYRIWVADLRHQGMLVYDMLEIGHKWLEPFYWVTSLATKTYLQVRYYWEHNRHDHTFNVLTNSNADTKGCTKVSVGLSLGRFRKFHVSEAEISLHYCCLIKETLDVFLKREHLIVIAKNVMSNCVSLLLAKDSNEILYKMRGL